MKLEKAALFRNSPVIVAQISEIELPGSYITEEVVGVPLIVLRDYQGEIRVFINACRHRGARLLGEENGQCKKLLVCPYHAWSYKLDGCLLSVPNTEVFGDAQLDQLNLVPVQFTVEFGFVWVVIDGNPTATLDIKAGLGPVLSQDFEDFGFSNFITHKKVSLHNDCNWKLVMDAFAEGYHLKTLHKNSLARFFLNASIFDDCAPHVRQMGGRRALLEHSGMKPEEHDFRLNTTLFYNVFPNAIIVFHPHWISQMSLFPVSTGKMRVVHRMLIDQPPENDEIQAKLDTSFEHIQGQVFEKEDLAISVDIQKTLASGANAFFTIGGLEQGVRIFHEARDNCIKQYQARS